MTARIHTHVDRIAYAGLFAAVLTATVVAAAQHGAWGAAAAGLAGPDLALLLGFGAGLAPGQLHPRSVPVYNAVHRFWAPVALTTAAATGLLGPAWLVAGLAWGAHVAMDRAVGYGLRTPEGHQRRGN